MGFGPHKRFNKVIQLKVIVLEVIFTKTWMERVATVHHSLDLNYTGLDKLLL